MIMVRSRDQIIRKFQGSITEMRGKLRVSFLASDKIVWGMAKELGFTLLLPMNYMYHRSAPENFWFDEDGGVVSFTLTWTMGNSCMLNFIDKIGYLLELKGNKSHLVNERFCG